ncbi:hypothetical protein HJB52_10605 [Rhizobium lentis]|uniref:hypothetical protein n=1 Tax=Rhizobium lentis TaxID=1138194 RepID=UPI001C8403BD|nr:hypothetical protein [Rhizobium lentis]MBX5102329.1 hypothetical protein [Rhizobium lentis]
MSLLPVNHDMLFRMWLVPAEFIMKSTLAFSEPGCGVMERRHSLLGLIGECQ